MSQIKLTAGEQVQGVLPVPNGGTGTSSLAANALLVGSGSTTITTLAPGASGNVPVSNGTSWVSQGVSVSTATGTLPVLNGGTGNTNFTSGGLLVGGGTSAVTTLNPGAAGNVPVSNGSAWYSQALTRAQIPEAATTSSSTSLTLTTTSSTWVYNGASNTTWTLPSVASSSGFFMILENISNTGTITLTAAGSDHIWRLGSVSTQPIAPNGSLQLVNNGTYWNALSNDLINNSASLTNIPLVTPQLTGYAEAVQAMGTVGSTATIPSVANGTIISATLTAGTTTTFTMPAVVAGASFMMEIHQNTTPTGNYSFTSAVWPGVGTPTATTTASYVDLISFVANTAGTAWRGSYVQGYPS